MMPSQFLHTLAPPKRSLRLDTLVRVRWLAVAGQTAAIVVVHYGLGYALPIGPCLAVVAVSAWLNVALRSRHPITRRLDSTHAAWLLAYDIAQLAALLFLTGGLQNPFAVLLLAPVLISATVLTPTKTAALGGFTILCATVLALAHMPLPWDVRDPLILPPVYILGIWLAIMLSMGFIALYAWQVSEEARQLSDALAATEFVLEREQHLSQLDGLAAAAAHELGTPLATIAVVAKELERELGPDSPHVDDVRLLREQSQRCREILGKLTSLQTGGAPFDTLPLSTLIEEVVAPHRAFGVDIVVILPPERGDEPRAARNPGLLYGLGNLVENAVDFARGRVTIDARWSDGEVVVTISDDGPGFAVEIMDRIGDPYVTSRGATGTARKGSDPEATGLGLGFFIAKTLLERSGAALVFANRPPPATGAVVRVRWPREDFEVEQEPA